MKSSLLLFSVLTLMVGCDAPQRTRNPNLYSNGYTSDGPNNTSGTLPSGTTGSSGGGTTGSSTGSSSGGGTGFESCDFSNSKGYGVDVGHVYICQSSADETIFKFKTTLNSVSIRTCLIPTYKDSSGSSTYIGQPQCTYTETDKVVQGRLYKNRTGYSNYPLNGVIVMKEPLLPEYFNCMQGYVNWPANVCSGTNSPYCAYWGPRCPYGSKSNVACDTEARNYMNNLCTSFKNKYSNSYLDIRLK